MRLSKGTDYQHLVPEYIKREDFLKIDTFDWMALVTATHDMNLNERNT